MKKAFLSLLLVFTAVFVFAQTKIPTVVIATFDTTGAVSPTEAAVITELFMSYLVDGNKINVVERSSFDKIIQQMRFQMSDWSDNNKVARLGRALNAEYVIRGQVMNMGNSIYISISMFDVNTTSIMVTAREQMRDFNQTFEKVQSLSKQILNKLPEPNYLVGRWESTASNGRKCILQFMSNSTIIIERYDWYTYTYSDSAGGNTRQGSARGNGFYATDNPASGGDVEFTFILNSPADIPNHWRNIGYIPFLRWNDSSKNSFTLLRWTSSYRVSREIGGFYSQWLPNSFDWTNNLYSEFYRIQ